MSTNLPLIRGLVMIRRGPMVGLQLGAHLDMIAKQYKKGTRTGVERGKRGFGKGSKTGLEKDKNGVETRAGFKRYKKQNLARFNNLERRGMAVLRRSTSFQTFFLPFHPFFSPVFDDFRQKQKKKVVKKWRNGKGKKSVLSCFFSRSHFFPFLSKHISIAEFVVNKAVSISTGFTPFYVNTSAHPTTPVLMMHGGASKGS